MMKHSYSYLFIIILFLASCKGAENVAYFQDTSDGQVLNLAHVADLKVQPKDKMTIVVNSSDPELADLFNLPIMARRVGTTNNISGQWSLCTYTVDENGNISFPVLGKIKVAGMGRQEIADHIQKELISRNLCKDALVTVEFDDLFINVMGEVARPGRFEMTRDNYTVLDAISAAGDLSIMGQRENVKVIRHENDNTHTYVLNLNDLASLTKNPAYYLKQGDVVYVEPNNYRKRQTTVNGNNVLSTSFWISVASLLTSVAVLLKK